MSRMNKFQLRIIFLLYKIPCLYILGSELIQADSFQYL